MEKPLPLREKTRQTIPSTESLKLRLMEKNIFLQTWNSDLIIVYLVFKLLSQSRELCAFCISFYFLTVNELSLGS